MNKCLRENVSRETLLFFNLSFSFSDVSFHFLGGSVTILREVRENERKRNEAKGGVEIFPI